MNPSYESSNVQAYIVGLRVPDRVSQLFSKLIRNLIEIIGENDAEREVCGYSDSSGKKPEKGGEERVTTWPMEPMVPILLCSERPKAPVTGLVPSCKTVIEVERRLILDKPSRWLTLPVNSGNWFEELRQKLSFGRQEHETRAAIHGGGPALPLCLGLPLLCINEEEFCLKAPEVNIDEVGGWRALSLICWEVEYLARRPWHHSVYWVPIWKRRLRRAISASNRNGNIA